jgi:hypothetical protein
MMGRLDLVTFLTFWDIGRQLQTPIPMLRGAAINILRHYSTCTFPAKESILRLVDCGCISTILEQI